MGVFRDEIYKFRFGQSECFYLVRPLALNKLRMAQDVVGRQEFHGWGKSSNLEIHSR